MTKVTKEKELKVNRKYAGDMFIDSDTFKLDLTNYRKNVSFDDKNPLLVGVPHCHFYHTFDSSGKAMSQCNAVGGHTHDVKVSISKDGDITATSSPAKSNSKLEDNHTHEVIYMKSDRFKVRAINSKAQEAIMNMGKI